MDRESRRSAMAVPDENVAALKARLGAPLLARFCLTQRLPTRQRSLASSM
jgi:hypothetical protein